MICKQTIYKKYGMKKIFVTFCLVISLAFSVSATDYVVSGSWFTPLNGLYIETGTMNGQPLFLYNDGSTQWAIGYNSSFWVIGDYFGGNIMDYYMSMDAGSPPLTGWNGLTLSVYLPQPEVAYSSFKFLENLSNDGSIGTSVAIVHNNFDGTSFSGTDGENFVNTGKVSISNVPTGLTASLIRNNSLALTLTLIGNAASHSTTDEIDNINLQFNNSAFSNGDAAGTANSSSSFSVDFIGVLTVGAGQMYTTITSAASAAGSRDILLLSAGTFTESEIYVSDKSLTIIGQGPALTIIQAAAIPNTASGRVFNFSNSSYLDDTFYSFEKVTIRNGKSTYYGGGIFVANTTLHIKNCAIESNYATTPAGDYDYTGGGGLYTQHSNLDVENSTFSDNHHVSSLMQIANKSGGGAIIFVNSNGDKNLLITNTTFSNNSAGNCGGAILVFPSTTNNNYGIINSTFLGNAAGRGGAYSTNGQPTTNPVNFKNDIMYGNTATDGGPQFFANNTTSYNFTNCNLENTNDIGAAIGSYTNCQIATDPLLGSLADNGGYTKTFALLPGSPAINAGMSGTEIPATDQRGYSNSGVKDIGSFEYIPSVTFTWTGTSGNDWNTVTNWSSNTVPDASANVTIPGTAANQPVVLSGGSADCFDLTVNADASLTVQSGGSLMTNGSVSGNISIQRTVEGSSNLDAYKYHLASVPLATSNNSLSGLFSGSYLYEYLPTSNIWSGMGNSSATELDETVGYMIYYPGISTTYSFTGAPNTGTFTPSVTYHGHADGLNFALVPNPYPSNIDWNAASGWTKTNIGTSIWIYNNGNYGVWNGSGGTFNASRYIAVGQAFFVQTTNTSPSLIMDNGVRTHSGATFLKNTELVAQQLRVNAVANGMADELLVGFGETNTNDYSPYEDAVKFYGADDAPQIYTMAGENKVTINALGNLSDDTMVPMNFETQFAGVVNLSFANMESFDPTLNICLKDELTNQTINLRNQPVYTFIHNPGNDASRFKLVFGGTIGIEEPASFSGNLWISGNTVYINAPSLAGQTGLLEVYNASCQKLLSKTIVLSKLSTLQINCKGFVVAKLTTGNEVMTVKGIIIN